MSQPFLGTIAMFAGNFAPRGWAMCQGQLYPISQNTALFAILGTTYGGNGTSTFALPDLRGRVPVGIGQGPGLSSYVEGQLGGVENTTLLTTQMPAHTHALSLAMNAKNSPGNSRTPASGVLASEGGGLTEIYSNATPDTTMAAGSVTGTASIAGGSQPFSIMQPYLAVNYIIALVGIFPSRN